ncbi:Release factor glutamine methyltransferase [bacterium HR30]|nr:Release factor glutamine methyltransferase [bacterium HR30]
MSEPAMELPDRAPTVPTVRAWLTEATRVLASAGVRDARVAAEWLALSALEIDRAALYARLGEALPPRAAARLDAWLQRCVAREPVAYVIGRREFWSREFVVTRAVLIPRPETEHLIEAALECFPDGHRGRRLQVCDVGTGSGCLGVTLACEWPAAVVLATDVSAAALAVARVNAQRHGVAARMHWVRTVALQGLADEGFDLLVANPPYLSWAELREAEPELEWEPRVALDGGEDGLAVIRLLVADAPRVLRPSGWFLLEVGAGQAEAVLRLVQHAGARQWFLRQDLAGWPRVVAAQW